MKCPLCRRSLTVKTLRYKHICGDGPLRNEEEHALSQQEAAEKAVRERMRARGAAPVKPSAPVGLSATPRSPQQLGWQSLLAASLR